MKPYGRTKKLKHNFQDNHPRPKKFFINWWENVCVPIKKRDRQKGKEDIKNQLEENQ